MLAQRGNEVVDFDCRHCHPGDDHSINFGCADAVRAHTVDPRAGLGECDYGPATYAGDAPWSGCKLDLHAEWVAKPQIWGHNFTPFACAALVLAPRSIAAGFAPTREIPRPIARGRRARLSLWVCRLLHGTAVEASTFF